MMLATPGLNELEPAVATEFGIATAEAPDQQFAREEQAEFVESREDEQPQFENLWGIVADGRSKSGGDDDDSGYGFDDDDDDFDDDLDDDDLDDDFDDDFDDDDDDVDDDFGDDD